jgi:hypothetical protein
MCLQLEAKFIRPPPAFLLAGQHFLSGDIVEVCEQSLCFRRSIGSDRGVSESSPRDERDERDQRPCEQISRATQCDES